MTALAAWLWQGIVLTVAVALVLRYERRMTAARRYVIWWITLAAVLVLPGSWWLGWGTGTPAGVPGVHGLSVASPPVSTPLVLPAVPAWLMSVAIGGWLGVVCLKVWRPPSSTAGDAAVPATPGRRAA